MARWQLCKDGGSHALSPTLTAKLTHETISHIAEADWITASDTSAPFLQLPLLSSKITVVDYAHTAFGKPVPLPVFTDDEGTPAVDVTLINKGLTTGILTNKKTAAALGLGLTGNANGGMVRARNTALLPGSDTPEAIIASIQDGYYLVDSILDIGDAFVGDFASQICEGYRIRNGVICEPLPPCVIYGTASEFWQSVSMVGNDFAWITDDCTKNGKKIMVAAGAPTIKCNLWLKEITEPIRSNPLHNIRRTLAKR